MADFFRSLSKVIASDASVLIGGETGTGKELVARAIHRHSRRHDAPMTVVNCGSISSNLVQSELFGHEKGAFTGATYRKIGSVEAADKGVLFLDEIGDLPLDQQASLLRTLQEKSVTRVGSTVPIPVDFRVVAATHVDLEKQVEEGGFRSDLYFRLNVLSLHLPALRERGDDILHLAEYFRRLYTREDGRRAPGPMLSRSAIAAIRKYRWPGNVRELMNRIRRAVVMSEGDLINEIDLGLAGVAEQPDPSSLTDARNNFERSVLADALQANGHRVSTTARQLGVSRVTLYRMMRRLNLDPGHRKPADSERCLQRS